MNKVIIKILSMIAIVSTIVVVFWSNFFSVTEDRIVEPFHKVIVNGPIQIFARKNFGDTVRVIADKDLLPLVSTISRNGTLIIELTKPVKHERILKVYISSERLKEMLLTGPSTLEVVDRIVRDSLKIIMSGSSEARIWVDSRHLQIIMNDASNIFMAGNTDVLKISLTGFSDIIAYKLQSKNCNIEIDAPEQSPGIFRVSVSDTLTVNAAIGNKRVVYYKGKPIINAHHELKKLIISK